ncbi:unnamed protein product [Pedinophyceae sp. YPF-701]|nr:unnamed protein product [Pedinophyceae sp. YPF-701]
MYPPGLRLIHAYRHGRVFTRSFYKYSVLLLTFLTYAAYHASRKPPSIVKADLHGDDSSDGGTSPALAAAGPPPSRHLTSDPTWTTHGLAAAQPCARADAGCLPRARAVLQQALGELDKHSPHDGSGDDTPASGGGGRTGGWAPFNGPDGKTRLGQSDLAFLAAYAIGMFFSGHLGDSMDLRVFLTMGMMGSGLFTCLYGMAYFWDVHNFYFFVGVQILAGLFQSTGWPSVVAVMGSWYGKGKRGLIMGIWNAHTSVGNIAGTIIAAAALAHGWGWSFIVPGLLMVFVGGLVYLFLVPEPHDAGHHNLYHGQSVASNLADIKTLEEQHRRQMADAEQRERDVAGSHGVGLLQAWRIPGVAPFAMCLFFSKLIAYTFLYWLPYYIRETEIGGRKLTSKEAGDLSVLFDIGGILGGVAAGHLSDSTGASSIVASLFVYTSIPVLYAYSKYGHMSFFFNIALMMVSGFFVNGPYALITTAVSADLGTHDSLKGSEKALATVTAIIDGCGSLGAALGPMATGIISELPGGFENVFIMLYSSALAAGLLLSRLALKELREIFSAPEGGSRDLEGGVSAGDEENERARLLARGRQEAALRSSLETGGLVAGDATARAGHAQRRAAAAPPR